MPITLLHDTPAASDKKSDNATMDDNLSDKSSDNAQSDKLLAYLAAHGEINTATAAQLIGRSPGTARRLLSRLISDGFVTATGANRNRKYKATK